MNELLKILRETLDNMSSVDLLSGNADSFQLILDAIPDNWGKVNGRWVELERPWLDRDAYDFIRPDWGALNKALNEGRIRILPEGFDCVCNPKTGDVCALHGRE